MGRRYVDSEVVLEDMIPGGPIEPDSSKPVTGEYTPPADQHRQKQLLADWYRRELNYRLKRFLKFHDNEAYRALLFQLQQYRDAASAGVLIPPQFSDV